MAGERGTAVGRIIALIYLGTIGIFVVTIFALLAAIWWIFDILSQIVRGEQIEMGRVILATPLRHHLKLVKYGAFGEEFPGFNPWDSRNTP